MTEQETKAAAEPPLDCRVSEPLREAERSIGLALARLGRIGPGGSKTWIGAWGEYKKLAQLMVKTRALADMIEQKERYGMHARKRRANT